jgi:hypothetical protein
MARAMYVGVDGKARKVKKLYVGVDGKARKVKKLYVGVNGKARLVYSADQFTYTGDYTVSQVTIDGVLHNLYTLTSSGTLTLSDPAKSKFWLCGAGGGGADGVLRDDADTCGSGGGGGGGYIKSGVCDEETYVIVIGVGGKSAAQAESGGDTALGSVIAPGGKGASNSNGGDGASGGGAGAFSNYSAYKRGIAGMGEGDSTYPFGLQSLGAHCAGGGAGADTYYISGNSVRTSNGCDGGTNGSDGDEITASSSTNGGKGGVKGGGNGGSISGSSTTASTKATFFGSGGGGGVRIDGSGVSFLKGTAGASGYQGVVYIAIPAAA